MYCFRCGAKNDDNTVYCTNCNDNLKNSYTRYYSDNQNTHQDQALYSYKYSNNGNAPKRKENDCDDQIKYRYQYSDATPQSNNDCNDQLDYRYQYSYGSNSTQNNFYDTNNNLSGDEKYMAAYIGSSYNIIKNSKFSILTLIFGPMYFIFKKMFIYAIIWIASLLVLSYYLSSDYYNILYYLINFFLAFKFKDIYLYFVEKKIERIKLQSLDLTTNEILNKCKQEGTMQVKYIVIFFIVISSALIVLAAYDEYRIYSSNPKEYNESEVIDDIEKNDEDIIQEIPVLSYTVPKEFIKIFDTEYKQIYRYQTPTNYCMIEINKHEETYQYNTIENYIVTKMNISETYDINLIQLNNVNWLKLTSSNINYYGIITNEGIGYIIKAQILIDEDKSCETLINAFINSLEFK